MTPQQFGMQVGKQLSKEAFFTLPAAAVGAGLGAVTSPEGHRTEGAYRGAAKGTGTAVGGLLGMPLGVIAASLLMKGKNLRPTARMVANRPMRRDMNARNIQSLQRLFAAVGVGVPVGGVAGGAAGYGATSAGLGKPSWESLDKQAARGDVAKALSRVVGINKEIKPFLNNGVPLRGKARASDLAGILANFRNSPMWARIRDTAMGDKAWEAKKLTPGNTTGALVLGKPVSPVQMQADNATGLWRHNRPYAEGGGSVLR